MLEEIHEQRSGLSNNLPGEHLEHLHIALWPHELSPDRTLTQKMFELQANTQSPIALLGAVFPADRQIFSHLMTLSFCVALTYLPLHDLKLPLWTAAPQKRPALHFRLGERRQESLLVKLAQEMSHPSRWIQEYGGGRLPLPYHTFK